MKEFKKEDLLVDFTTDNFLSGYEDEDRDCLRDFINYMNWGYNHQLDLSPNPIKDEVEYQKRVFEFYIYDRIYNHYLISLLIDDREGRLDKSISEMTVKELTYKLSKQTEYTYNRYVLRKDNCDEKVILNSNF
jgi:hypothetical protein